MNSVKRKYILIIVLLSIVCSLQLFFLYKYYTLFHTVNGMYCSLYTRIDDCSNAIESWENTVAKLRLDEDIVFYGDSITCFSDFQKAFPDRKIINLGNQSEGIRSMCNRYTIISKVHPEKVFVMGGGELLL